MQQPSTKVNIKSSTQTSSSPHNNKGFKKVAPVYVSSHPTEPYGNQQFPYINYVSFHFINVLLVSPQVKMADLSFAIKHCTFDG